MRSHSEAHCGGELDGWHAPRFIGPQGLHHDGAPTGRVLWRPPALAWGVKSVCTYLIARASPLEQSASPRCGRAPGAAVAACGRTHEATMHPFRRVSSTVELLAAVADRVPEVELEPGATFVFVNSTDAGGGPSALHLTHSVTISAPLGTHAVLDAGASALDLRRVLTVTVGVRAVLRRVTLTGGYSQQWGGGVRIELGATLILEASYVRNCTLSTVVANAFGGGVDNEGTLTLFETTVEGNTVTSSSTGDALGGGIANGGTLTLNASGIVNNTVVCADGRATGGGLENTRNSVATLLASTVEGNTATSSSPERPAQGGGVNSWGSLILVESRVEGNRATASSMGSAIGGGLAVNSGTFMLAQSALVNNLVASAQGQATGGGLQVGGTAVAELIDSIVESNTATSSSSLNAALGGGVTNGGALSLTRIAIINNTAASAEGQALGGGLNVNANSVAELLECTVAGNRATSSTTGDVLGGGVVNSGNLTLAKSGISNNMAASAEGQAQGGGLNNFGDGVAELIESTVEGNMVHSVRSTLGGGVANQGVLSSNGSAIKNNVAASAEGRARGGGLFHEGRALLTRTLLAGNAVRSRGNPTGMQLENLGAVDSLVYVLPTPLGHWLGGTLECQRNECTNGPCPNQPCDWQSLLSEWLVNVPVSAFDDGTFPPACFQGYYGDSNAPDAQRTSMCSARCADPFATTAREGAVSREECVCIADYFADAAGVCMRCTTAGVNCTDRLGTTLATLELARNHWRLSENTTDVIPCTSEADSVATPCRGGSDASDYCFEGLRGPLCRVCVAEAHYYDATIARCVSCDATGGAAITGETAIYLGVGLGVGLLLWLMRWLRLRHSQQPSASTLCERRLITLFEHTMKIAPHLGLIGKFKIAIGYYQVTIIAPEAFNVAMPMQYLQWMRSLNWLSFDWLSVHVDAACIGGFRARLLLDAIRPMTALGLLIVGAALCSILHSRCRLAPAERDGGEAHASPIEAAKAGMLRVLPLTLAILFALVPTIASRIFSTFSCAVFGYDDALGTTRAFLAADYSIECFSDEYVSLRFLSGWLMLLWPIGVPALFAWLLYVARQTCKARDILPRAIRFLHDEYKDSHRYWELFELGRKLMLNGFVFLIPLEHALKRLLLAIVVSICHMVLLQQAQPYKQASTAFVAVASSVLLLCTLILFLLVSMYDELDEEQIKGFFGFGSVFPLAAIIFGINVGVLVVVMALFMYQYHLENGQLAPLRVTETGEEPHLTLAEGKRWHLFLSHNWWLPHPRPTSCS